MKDIELRAPALMPSFEESTQSCKGYMMSAWRNILFWLSTSEKHISRYSNKKSKSLFFMLPKLTGGGKKQNNTAPKSLFNHPFETMRKVVLALSSAELYHVSKVVENNVTQHSRMLIYETKAHFDSSIS